MTNLQIGTKIKIIHMKDEPQYDDKIGKVTFIDDIGQLHGTWGGLAVNPSIDEIEILYDPE